MSNLIKVSVPYTKLWYMNDATMEVNTMEISGLLKNVELKELLATMSTDDINLTFIKKEYLKETFEVEDYELLKLKTDTTIVNIETIKTEKGDK